MLVVSFEDRRKFSLKRRLFGFPQHLILKNGYSPCWGYRGLSRLKARPTRKRNRVLVYGVPLVAVLLVGTVFALNLNRPPLAACSSGASQTPVLDFTVALSVQIQNVQGNASRFIIPPAVGIPGGIWASHQLDKYGTDGRSPLCTDQPSGGNYQGYSLIHVRSNSNLTFTLGDFFAVWGQPLGNGTALNSAYILPKQGYQWEICIGNPRDTTNIKPGHWANETMVPNKFITLMYFPPSGNGCLGY